MATYYVQTGAASDNSGGTDADDSLSRSGSDGVSTSDTTFESEAANFVAGDAGRGIWINTTVPAWRIIASVTDENTVVLNTALASTQNSLSWKIGGSFKTIDLAQNKLAAGDTLYIAPGVYREAGITIDVSGSAGNLISFIGDPQNTRGFKDSSAVTIAAGYVRLSVWTTDDATTVNTTLLTVNAKSYLWFENLIMEGGGAYTSYVLNASLHVTFKRCCFLNGDANADNFRIVPPADTTLDLLMDECYFFSAYGYNVYVISTASGSAEYDTGITVKNSVLISGGGTSLYVNPTAGAFEGTGGDILGCFFYSGICIRAGAGWTASSTYPLYVRDCFLIGTNSLYAGVADSIDEDYNVLWSGTPRTVVDAGANSIVGAQTSGTDTKFFRFNLLEPWMYGFLPRPPFSPMEIGLQLGAGTDLSHTTDAIGRLRPSGSGTILPTIGALERHEYGVKETTVKDAGDASLKLTGPGDHEIRIPVDASATTISIKARFDSGTYGGANYPQAILLDASEIGVTTETETATIAASDAWETLTFTQFTPTAKGWVTIRLVNRGSGGDDICYFDTIAVT